MNLFEQLTKGTQKIISERIPAEIKVLTQWITWHYEYSNVEGRKPAKIPTIAGTQTPAKSNDASTWRAFSECVDVKTGSDGIMFVFTESDPYTFIDFDNALLDGVVKPEVAEILSGFTTGYVELSPSKKGLHLIVKGKKKYKNCKKRLTCGAEIEIYDHARFGSFTGLELSGYEQWVNPAEAQQSLDALMNTLWPQSTIEEKPVLYVVREGAEIDQALLQRMQASRSVKQSFGAKATFSQLWNKDHKALAKHYPSATSAFDHSSADQALCNHLAYYLNGDEALVKMYFEASSLVRAKWLDRADYARDTVHKACKDIKIRSEEMEVAKSEAPNLRFGLQLMTVPTQMKHFEGCIFINDESKILVPTGELLGDRAFKANYGGYIFELTVGDSDGKTTTDAWKAFTECQGNHFPTASTTCFRPPQVLGMYEGMANVYKPVNSRRVAGESMIREHVRILFQDERNEEILMSYMASLVQNTGTKFSWCPIIQGTEGNGKTYFINKLSECIGHEYSFVPNSTDLDNKFNYWIYKKLFIGVDEIEINGNFDKLDLLKIYIGSKRIDIQGKGRDQKNTDNYANFLMCTNAKRAIPMTDNTRRYAPLFCVQQTRAEVQDQMGGNYFPRLWAENYATINEYLHNYVIAKEFDPAGSCQMAPITSNTSEVVELTENNATKQVREIIEEGSQGMRGGWVSSIALKRHSGKINNAVNQLRALGYIKHPGLRDGGRLNNTTCIDDGKKPVLYVKDNHYSCGMFDPKMIREAYLNDQQ